MLAGSVVVSSDGTYTGTGMAKALMDAVVASPLVASLPTATEYNKTMKLIALRTYGELVTAFAVGIVAHIQAMATVTVSTNALGTGVPSSPVTLPGGSVQ